MIRVEIKSFSQVVIGHVEHADLHAGTRTIYIVLWIGGEEVDRTAELDVGSLVVLLVETLGAQCVMC